MGYKMRTYSCTVCGTITTRKRKSRDPKVCHSCGVNAMVRNINQMVGRYGESWHAFTHSRGIDGRPRTIPREE